MNIWEGRLHFPIARFLEREKPAILSAQELLSKKYVAKTHTQFLTQEDLLERGFFEQIAEGATKEWMEPSGYQIRCATLTKNPVNIIAQHVCELYRNHDDQSDDENRCATYSGLLHTEIKLGNNDKGDAEIVHVLNHHGRLIKGHRMGHKISDYNFQKIADYIAGLNGAVILSGDFNLYKEATSFAPLKQIGITNLNDVYGVEAARNEFSWKPEECVSHIFVNDAITVHDYHVATDNVSDHLPLILKFSLKK